MNRIRFDLLIVLIMLGAPFLQWLIVKLREQADIAKKKRESERAQNEALRTGRPVQNAPAPAAPKADAASRQQRLRELRQKQIEQANQRKQQPRSPVSVRTGGTATTGGAAPAPVRRAPAAPVPTRAPQAPTRPVPAPSSRQPSPIAPGGPGVSERARQIEELRRQQQQRLEQGRSDVERAVRAGQDGTQKYESVFATARRARGESAEVEEPEQEQPSPVVLASVKLRTLTRDDIRRAVVLTEVFAPPIGLRTNDPLSRG